MQCPTVNFELSNNFPPIVVQRTDDSQSMRDLIPSQGPSQKMSHAIYHVARDKQPILSFDAEAALSRSLMKVLDQESQIERISQQEQLISSLAKNFEFDLPRISVVSQFAANFQMLLSITKCYSSVAMSHLMKWRNPPKPNDGQQDTATPSHFRKICTQIALPVLTVSAAVEFVAYGAIVLGAKALSPITKRPEEFVQKHNIDSMMSSAFFTMKSWTLTSMVKNFAERRLAAEEHDARQALRTA